MYIFANFESHENTKKQQKCPKTPAKIPQLQIKVLVIIMLYKRCIIHKLDSLHLKIKNNNIIHLNLTIILTCFTINTMEHLI